MSKEPRKLSFNSHLPAASLLLASASSIMACATGEGPPGPQPTGYESFGTDGDGGPVDTEGDTDGAMPEEGHWWCMEATNSSYEDGAGQTHLIPSRREYLQEEQLVPASFEAPVLDADFGALHVA